MNGYAGTVGKETELSDGTAGTVNVLGYAGTLGTDGTTSWLVRASDGSAMVVAAVDSLPPMLTPAEADASTPTETSRFALTDWRRCSRRCLSPQTSRPFISRIKSGWRNSGARVPGTAPTISLFNPSSRTVDRSSIGFSARPGLLCIRDIL